MMKYKIVFFYAVLLSSTVHAVNVHYWMARYQVADPIKDLLVPNSNDGGLIISYGRNKQGKLQLISFQVEDNTVPKDCTNKVFLEVAVLHPEDKTRCDPEYLQAFRFFNHNGRIWTAKDGTQFYLFHRDDTGFLALLPIEDNKILRIESRFPKLDDFKALLNSRRPS